MTTTWERGTRSRGRGFVSRARGVLCAALVGSVAACGSLTFPDEAPSIQGDIVGIGDDTPFGGATTIWVKEDPDDPCGVVFGTDEAFIGRRLSDGEVREIDFDQLAIGQTVRVWSGPIAESCPGQGSADAIEVLPG